MIPTCNPPSINEPVQAMLLALDKWHESSLHTPCRPALSLLIALRLTAARRRAALFCVAISGYPALQLLWFALSSQAFQCWGRLEGYDRCVLTFVQAAGLLPHQVIRLPHPDHANALAACCAHGVETCTAL